MQFAQNLAVCFAVALVFLGCLYSLEALYYLYRWLRNTYFWMKWFSR